MTQKPLFLTPKNVFSDDSIQQPMDTIPYLRWYRPLKWSKTAFLGTFWWVPFRTSRPRTTLRMTSDQNMTWKHRFWPSKTLIFEVQNLRFLLKPAQTLQNLWLDSSCYFSTNSDVSKHDPKTTVFDPQKRVFWALFDGSRSEHHVPELLWEWHLIKTWPKHCFYTETTTFIRFWQNPADTCNVATVVITCTYIGHTHVQTHIKLMFYVFYMSKLCKNTCKNDAQTQITTVDTLQVLHMYNMCNTKTHVLHNFYIVLHSFTHRMSQRDFYRFCTTL